MMGHDSGDIISMVQEMTRFMGNCSKMMESDVGEKRAADGVSKPVG